MIVALDESSNWHICDHFNSSVLEFGCENDEVITEAIKPVEKLHLL